jgi:hypothetical protein
MSVHGSRQANSTANDIEHGPQKIFVHQCQRRYLRPVIRGSQEVLRSGEMFARSADAVRTKGSSRLGARAATTLLRFVRTFAPRVCSVRYSKPCETRLRILTKDII